MRSKRINLIVNEGAEAEAESLADEEDFRDLEVEAEDVAVHPEEFLDVDTAQDQQVDPEEETTARDQEVHREDVKDQDPLAGHIQVAVEHQEAPFVEDHHTEGSPQLGKELSVGRELLIHETGRR